MVVNTKQTIDYNILTIYIYLGENNNYSSGLVDDNYMQ